MSRVVTMLALALCLSGCGLTRGEQVPLITDPTEPGGGCWLLHEVVDVIADPISGTPIVKSSGASLKWPRGYSAWRAGTEVEVRDPSGRVMLRTGGRYELCPTPNSDYTRPLSDWVIGDVTPCPDCELGGGID